MAVSTWSACSRPRVSSTSSTAVSRTCRSKPSRMCATSTTLPPVAATQASRWASAPGRSGTRVSTTTVAPLAAGLTWPPSSAATPTAPAPSTTTLQRSSSTTIASATSSSSTTATPSSHSRSSSSVSSPGRLIAIPSAIVSAVSTGIARPCSSDAGYGAHAATWTPTTSTSGRSDLIAIATPEASPPPPTGTTTFARSGTCSSSSSPSEPWPATMSGSSNGCTNARPPSRARSCAAAMQSSTDSPPTCTIAPCPAAASALAIGASAGTNTSQRTPRAAAAAASPCAWFPADAATTPFAQPASPSAASFADAPRTLNEPVRCRFSAFSTTFPPACSEIVRVERTGVPAATFSTSARAASMSVRDGKDRVDLDVGPERERGDADRAARRRRVAEVAGVGGVDVLERRDVGHVDAAAHGVVAERRAGGGCDDGQVVEAAPRLGADVALDQAAGVGVDRRLARQEDQPAGLDGVGVRTGGLGGPGRADRFAMMGHGKALYVANRLAAETSPYLLQHAENPVDWYPWGDEALTRAREEDKPILVSIGYSACHWCHVMEHESFEDPAVAALMNERFVCIKVDREERPDVDAIYMDA